MKIILGVSTLILSQLAIAKPNCEISTESPKEIATKQIREVDLNADFISPKNCSPQMVILAIGGSEGGINTRVAQRFARLGYGVYALGYFNVDGSKLPRNLVQVPIEYFKKAIGKIRSSTPDNKCCYLVGGSKGAEAILTLLAVTGTKYKKAVLLSGADRVMEGLGKNNQPANKSSWSYQGRDIPFTPMDGLSLKEFFKMAWNLFKVPPRLREMYSRSIANKEKGPAGLLPIEKIKTKILFLSGEDDNLWPSSTMGRSLEEQFNRNGKGSLFKHISYPGTGHAILGGHLALETKSNQNFLGGNIQDSKEADRKAFATIISFLESP